MSIEFLNEIGKKIALGGAKLIFLKLIPFHSNGLCTCCDHATPNFISNFNNHYSDLSKEVYNISASHGGWDVFVNNYSGVVLPVGYFLV